MRTVNGALERAERPLRIGVDLTPPTCSKISINHHPRGQVIQYTDSVALMSAEWDCFDAPPFQDVPLYCEWAVGSYPGGEDEMPWTPAKQNGVNIWAPTTMKNGRLCFATVKCLDQAYLSTEMKSGGLMPDLVPPVITYQPIIIFPDTITQTDFWGRNQGVNASWGFEYASRGRTTVLTACLLLCMRICRHLGCCECESAGT